MRFLFLVTLMSTAVELMEACTNIMVTNAGTTDGRAALLGDNDDTAKRFGGVTHFDAGEWPEGATRDIYDFETSIFRGVISQPTKTV